MVTVNWMIDQIPDAETDLGLGILEHILIGTPASPLRNNSGLGEDIAGRGLDDELLQPMLSVGLKGIDPSGAEKVEALVLETLRALASKRSNFACARTISAHFRVASRQCCTRSRLGSTTAARRRRWRSRRRFSERAESDETELARSIIGTIGDIDAYQLPDAKGYTSMQQYLAGETEEVRQRRRDQILGARVNDFRAFADALTDLTAHGAPSMQFVQPIPVALGSCTYRG